MQLLSANMLHESNMASWAWPPAFTAASPNCPMRSPGPVEQPTRAFRSPRRMTSAPRPCVHAYQPPTARTRDLPPPWVWTSRAGTLRRCAAAGRQPLRCQRCLGGSTCRRRLQGPSTTGPTRGRSDSATKKPTPPWRVARVPGRGRPSHLTLGYRARTAERPCFKSQRRQRCRGGMRQ